MKQVLISEQEGLQSRWLAAFPGGQVVTTLKQALRVPKKIEPLYWLDLTSFEAASGEAALEALDALSVRSKVVVLSPVPEQSESSKMIRAGAQGYCHWGTPSERLQEIALVIEHDGYWLPKDMVRRLAVMTRRVGESKSNPEQDPEQLTQRERAVAKLVARGANNAEIATLLHMSERTVKSHLSSIFQQLKVRDRVQLALVMNRIPVDGGSAD